MEKNKGTGTSRSLLETKDLLFLWSLLRKNILIILIFPAIFYVVGYVYAYRLKDIYGAKAQLLLKSQETYDYQDPIYKGLGAYGAYMDVANQIRILQSRDIIAEVVEKMDANTSYFVTGRLRKKEVFGTLPFSAGVEIFDPNVVYENPMDIVIQDFDNYTLNYSSNGVDVSKNGVFGQGLETKGFILMLDKNYDFNEDNIDGVISSNYQVIFHTDRQMVSHFQRNMVIDNIDYTSILEVSVTDDIGVRAKVFLDTLCAVFVDYSMRSQLEINDNTLLNIDKQIGEVQKILVEIETELLNFKDDNDIINLTKEEEAYFTQYIDYSEVERELRFKLSSVLLLENYIQTSEDERLLPPSFYILKDDAYLQLKVQEFYNQQLAITDKIYSISEVHPSIKRMKDELIEMRKDILTYLKNLKVALNAQIADNDKMILKYKKEVQGIPRSLQGVDNIRRELDVNNKMYLFLLEKKTNTLIAKAGIIPQVQVVETAVSLGVIGPEKDKIRNLFLFFGIISGLAVAFIRKVFFERIESVRELKDATYINVVGGIPFVPNVESSLVVQDNPKSNITESFRTLRSNISFMGKNQGTDMASVILISSFFPGEGKTFCSSNLSILLAKTEKKVLLIDFDMHKPKIHKSFDMDNTIGMSNFLIGQQSIEKIIHKDFIENLDIITCGPIPPNPSELIMKRAVSELIEKAKKEYDYIIMDTPPFGLLNDSIELGKHADIFLGVINTKNAKQRGVRIIEEILSKHENLSVGLILNGVRQSKISYYYNKYSYKYSYRYSYTDAYGYGENYGEVDYE